MATNSGKAEWKTTACNLCYSNCGIQVQLGGENDRHIVRVKGDKKHPASKGYTCNKALQIDYYQNGRDRLTAPLRRRPDGTFEEIDWDTAITEVAGRLKGIRDEHGGDKIFRFGGGGQGNHLGGAYFGPVAAALQTKYKSNALAQEKTGFAWVMGRMFGGNVHGELHDTNTLLIVGKNPWQSNSIQRARIMVREISKDPERTLIVLDPRRTETAEFADYHLAVKPGRDAWCLSAMIAHIIQENLVPHNWLNDNTNGSTAVLQRFGNIPVDAWAVFSGIDPTLLKDASVALAKASTAAYYEDLGVQMAPNSTLVSYLNLVLMIITGNFGKQHTMAVLSQLTGPFFGIDDIGQDDENGYETNYNTAPVTGSRIVSGLVPCNAIPDEILTDHPNRFRAMIIESSNPAHSMADSAKWREALRALDLVVVMDVAMTETAREADYILPSPSQFEKWEATFFNFDYPRNVHHLRAPILEPEGNTLPEPEIHARIFEALGALDPEILEPLKEAALNGLEAYGTAAMAFMGQHPQAMRFMPYVVYRTLGPCLPKGAEAAAMYWPMAQNYAAANPDSVRRAGLEGEGLALGNALFKAIIAGRSGIVFGEEDRGAAFDRIKFDDKKIRLNLAEMLDEVEGLGTLRDVIEPGADYPFILAAGERRSYTANTVIRDPRWRKSNDATSMSIHPSDALAAGLSDGSTARLVTEAGHAEIVIAHDDRLRPGTLSIPNGLGLIYPDETGKEQTIGVSTNELTSLAYKDKFFGTPFHKFVPARVEAM